MLDSALRSVSVDLDAFAYNFVDNDPMKLSDAVLRSVDLMQQRVLLLMTDREGSQ